MEQGAASEEAGCSGKHWEKDSFHPTKAIARDQEKSTESISTRFLVGTGGAPPRFQVCTRPVRLPDLLQQFPAPADGPGLDSFCHFARGERPWRSTVVFRLKREPFVNQK